jgi:riboflavin kinase/FMN adenylyltransferase
VILKDSLKLLNLSPADFVEHFLIERFAPRVVIEGEDFHFGYGRSGDIDTLRQLAKGRFEITVVPAKNVVLSDGTTQRISSTLIRRLLHKGDVADAAKALGRNYRLIGRVIKGRGKGKELGFPTANINATEQIIPAEGVYAGFVAVGDSVEELCFAKTLMPAVFSIGRAKTFISEHPLLLEAHVLDKTLPDLNGKYLAMDFAAYIRGQQRFSTQEELKQQIEKDCRTAKSLLTLD